MYIINLTYKVSLEAVDKYLDKHIQYLDEQYNLGTFLASGRKISKTGGVILSNIGDMNKLSKIIDKDPFKINDLAHYEIIEFKVSKACAEFEFLKEKNKG